MPVQIGYPRRFDPAYVAARAAVDDGELGWVHTVRSTTLDPAPAPRGYIEVSGGIFRDCSVHDFDTVRWVTGREVVEVYATGSARGDDFFAEFGDVATAQTLLTFDDGATAVVSNTRYNARGYDVRLELHGTDDSVAAGWSDTTPLRNLEPGSSWPAGSPGRSSWTGWPTRSAPNSPRSPKSLPGNGLTVHRRRRDGRGLHGRGRHPFPATAPPGADRRGPEMTTTPATTSTAPLSENRARIAGAPISWGVCEVPNWGYQLAPSRVLAEMQDVGLSATELGPDGFLPADPDQMAGVLDAHQLTAVGGFTPVVMHQPGHDPLPEIDRILGQYDATGAEVLVLSAVSGLDGYDSRPVLDDDGWELLLGNLDRICDRAAEHGVRAVLHPHVGHHGRERRRGPAGPRGVLRLAVPGHRAPADRWHRPGRTHPAGARPDRPHPPQGRGQPDRRQGASRSAHLHRGRGRGHVPAARHRRRRHRSPS